MVLQLEPPFASDIERASAVAEASLEVAHTITDNLACTLSANVAVATFGTPHTFAVPVVLALT
tara:strand:- start:204 stop:392 length:189 start_codon:yes stop_codon:yes gene_type:complete